MSGPSLNRDGKAVVAALKGPHAEILRQIDVVCRNSQAETRRVRKEVGGK